MCEPIILPSARKRGIADEDILHAWRSPSRVFEQDDDMIMYIGATPSGGLLEVGVVIAGDGTQLIAHAMPARDKYLR
jgi:hypothetical protein